MAKIKLYLINRARSKLIFSYDRQKFEVSPYFSQTVEVETGSYLYVAPEGKPEKYELLTWLLMEDTEVNCRMEGDELYITGTAPNIQK